MDKNGIIDNLILGEERYGLAALLGYVFGDNIRVRLCYSLRDCGSSIDELNLSVRSQNALRRAGVMTLGELIDRLNEGDIKSIRSLGRKSLSEIQTKIVVYGYDKLTYQERREFFSNLLEENIENMRKR